MAQQDTRPSEKEIEDLAYREGHDADIASNLGAIKNEGRDLATSRASSIDRDIEKEAGLSKDGSTASSRANTTLDKDAEAQVEHDVEEVADPNIVDWDGPDDPANPMNWSDTRKWAAIAVVSLITFLAPLGSSSFAPGVPQLMAEFGSDSTLLSGFVVSVYVLGFATGPLIMAPMSEMFGRLPLYHISAVLFVIWNIACALSQSLTQLIIFRFLAGTFGATPLAVGGGTIADVARPEHRATAMALWILGPTVGPVIGPVAGGFICAHLGWRWNFWIIAMLGGAVVIAGMFFLRETYAPAILEKKTRKLIKETGNKNLRSKLDSGLSTKDLFLLSIVRPSKMLLFSPTCFSQSFYVALTYAYLYLMFTTVSEVFLKQYHFRDDLVGLAFLGIGIGSFGGQFGYTYFENKTYAKHKARGDLVPEHKLLSMIPGALLLPPALFWYGWSVEAKVHWICPIIATGMFGLALLLIFMSASNYLVEVFTTHAASAMAANTVLRSLVAAILPLAGPSLYSSLGYGWGASLLGFLAAAMIPIPFLFIRYGEWLRGPRFELKL